jgi:hypothetical protein
MNAFLTKAVLGATLAATSMTAIASPAEAQRYRRDRGNDTAGIAIIAGIAGLAIGAAIASSDNNRDRDRRVYRDQQYQYNNPNYDQYNRDPRYNQNNYYNNDNGYNYQNCRVEKRYDPYYGRKVKVRVCY